MSFFVSRMAERHFCQSSACIYVTATNACRSCVSQLLGLTSKLSIFHENQSHVKKGKLITN